MKTCPRCRIPLEELSVGRLRIDMCRTCEGSWYDAEELTEIMSLERPLEHVMHSDLAPTLVEDHTENIDLNATAACPVCGANMDRYLYMLDSKVFIDRCNEHGVWLDDGELSGIVEHYVKSSQVDAATREKARQAMRQVKLKDNPGLVGWLKRLFTS
jgi:Zn-finger nucleic acid-binding protein